MSFWFPPETIQKGDPYVEKHPFANPVSAGSSFRWPLKHDLRFRVVQDSIQLGVRPPQCRRPSPEEITRLGIGGIAEVFLGEFPSYPVTPLASARGIAQPTAPPHLTSLEVGVRALASRIKNQESIHPN